MKDHKGMQGTEYLTGENAKKAEHYWLEGRNKAVEESGRQSRIGTTKQLCNRPMEAYMYHTVIVTATEWENFWALRCPQYIIEDNGKEVYYRSRKDLLNSLNDFPTIKLNVSKRTEIQWLEGNKGQADIHMMATAEAMWDAMNESTPKELKAGEWHIPFRDSLPENNDASLGNLLPALKEGQNLWNELEFLKVKIATAMCARVSYTTIGEEKEISYSKLVEIHDRLVKQVPLHASPMEHCARTMSESEFYIGRRGDINSNNIDKYDLGWSRNFRGFTQYRSMFDNENIIK